MAPKPLLERRFRFAGGHFCLEDDVAAGDVGFGVSEPRLAANRLQVRHRQFSRPADIYRAQERYVNSLSTALSASGCLHWLPLSSQGRKNRWRDWLRQAYPRTRRTGTWDRNLGPNIVRRQVLAKPMPSNIPEFSVRPELLTALAVAAPFDCAGSNMGPARTTRSAASTIKLPRQTEQFLS